MCSAKHGIASYCGVVVIPARREWTSRPERLPVLASMSVAFLARQSLWGQMAGGKPVPPTDKQGRRVSVQAGAAVAGSDGRELHPRPHLHLHPHLRRSGMDTMLTDAAFLSR